MNTLPASAPLIVTDEEVLLNHLCDLTAGTNIVPHIVPDLDLEWEGWHTASTVLLDPLAASEARATGYAHRPGVVVITHEPPHEATWEACTRIGAEYLVHLPTGSSWLRAHLLNTVATHTHEERV